MLADIAGDPFASRSTDTGADSWIATINGKVSTIVQEIEKPSCAPA
jgi:hypothetical protein